MKDETAAEILERHPEVKGCVLEWLWPFWAIYEDRGLSRQRMSRKNDVLPIYGC